MAVISLTPFLQSLPLGTRILSSSILAFSTLLFFLRLFTTDEGLHLTFQKQDSALAFPALVLVPGASFWYPWTLLTSAFCETSFIEFIITILTIPLGARYLERVWGWVELLRFCAIVIIGSNIIAWGLAIILFAVLRSDTAIYGTQYHGMEALQVAFLVALTQLIPEHQVQLFKGYLKLKVKDLPMLYVTFSNVACLLGYASPFILIQFGWLISWVYLRFFKSGEGNDGIRGDRSEAFAFVNWFPPIAHPVVSRIATFVHNLCVRLHIVQPWSGPPYGYSGLSNPNGHVDFDLESYAQAQAGGSGSGSGSGSGGAGSARAEAERRRAMALKALDQRLAGGPGKGKNQTSSTSNKPERSGSVSSVSTQLPAYTPQTIPSTATATATTTTAAESTSSSQAPLSSATVVIPASPSTSAAEEKRKLNGSSSILAGKVAEEEDDGAGDWDSDSDPGADPKSKPTKEDGEGDGDIALGSSK